MACRLASSSRWPLATDGGSAASSFFHASGRNCSNSAAVSSLGRFLLRKSLVKSLGWKSAKALSYVQIYPRRTTKGRARKCVDAAGADRLAILELRAARGWSLRRTAREFSVTRATIRSWLRRLEEDGPNALVQAFQPVNRFSDYVRYLVQRLKVLCPLMGKKKIAEMLARAGLHLGTTIVGRILMEKPVGKHGSVAVVERLILTMKSEGISRLVHVPSRRQDFREELARFFEWYNEFRPHGWLRGATPNEIYFKRRPANRLPRFEPRERWPRPSRCAGPQTLVEGQPGVRLTLDVSYHAGRKHLPIVTLRRAA